MNSVGHELFQYVQRERPDVYETILNLIQPHRIESVIRLFQLHLKSSVSNIDIFNKYKENIPNFILAFIKAIVKRFPQPGDPFGIYLTCRITKSDTQTTLDSKHLQSSLYDGPSSYNVDKHLKFCLNKFSNQSQIFELAIRHQYAAVFLRDSKPESLLQRLSDACILERDPQCTRVLYRSARDLLLLLRRLDTRDVVAFSDIRYIFQKCGIVCHFFNMVEILYKQYFTNDASVHERDVLTIVKYQCRTGKPLPLTREGLAKNKERSPIEVLSFEAPKKNYVRLSVGPEREKWYNVDTSADKIFFGQQFNEGTGYKFALMPKESKPYNSLECC
ncbi:uncharacterized protein CEXT_25951 [Caerostris extrusa]|uniref:Uncharacterized protein n=1 Tax=Caerostris extrusa TaxID=172846 RepID=A0AAV4QZC4_CAEEX|nr:uncharacterized protein CEXT_25951 [Caerostris extrusa]